MSNPFLAREPVASTPYAQVLSKHDLVLGNGLSWLQLFDLGIILSDPFQTGSTAALGLPSVGPILDGYVFSTGIGTIDILVSAGATYRSILAAPIAVAANAVLVYCSGLRVPSWLLQVIFTNTSGGNATIDFVAVLRSN